MIWWYVFTSCDHFHYKIKYFILFKKLTLTVIIVLVILQLVTLINCLYLNCDDPSLGLDGASRVWVPAPSINTIQVCTNCSANSEQKPSNLDWLSRCRVQQGSVLISRGIGSPSFHFNNISFIWFSSCSSKSWSTGLRDILQWSMCQQNLLRHLYAQRAFTAKAQCSRHFQQAEVSEVRCQLYF